VEAVLKRSYSRLHRIIEVLAIGLFGLLAFGLASKLYATLESQSAWIATAISVALGYVLADLVSGIVHWLADRYGTEETPLLGENYIRPFREHHDDPKAITRHDFIETNGSNCIISVPVMAAVFFSTPASASPIAAFFLGATLTFCLTIFATNQFHKWAHMDKAPVIARALMKMSLILGAEHHGAHHNSPFDRNYCITVGWWNPLLHRWKLFERAEACLKFLTGARPYDAALTKAEAQ
jgi:ubiquitin-conjugating enzyme E2 variant